MTGLIVKVTATDTLDAIAARYNVGSADILATNGISDPNIVVGQILVLPGAQGPGYRAIRPVPKPIVRPPTIQTSNGGGSKIPPPAPPTPAAVRPGRSSAVATTSASTSSTATGGLDIAADYGSTVRAAADGTVTFAGWKNNGGGYQVWIAHGSTEPVHDVQPTLSGGLSRCRPTCGGRGAGRPGRFVGQLVWTSSSHFRGVARADLGRWGAYKPLAYF